MSDHIRVAIVTDTHIGYRERDPNFQDESFEVFDEALENANLHGADIVIHAGDLFEDMSPSRHTIIRTMQIIQNHLIGAGNPPEVIYSEGLTLKPNWLDENIRIKIPLFIINGNHDRPGGYKFTSADELLSVPKLINYFKSSDKADNVILEPVVLQRGCIRLNIYGLSYLPDSKFLTILQDHKLQLVKPPPADASVRRTFTILMVHQNKTTYGKSRQQLAELLSRALPSTDEPHHVDLVIWGHEHENMVSRTKFDTIEISQPGSTICTQLKKCMATERSMAILDIYETSDSFEPLTLSKARRFIYDSIDLNDITKNATTLDKRLNLLREQIDALLSEDENPDPSRLPLVRIDLRSTANENMKFNVRQLAYEYTNKVANPETMLRVKEHKGLSITSTTKSNDIGGSARFTVDDHLEVEDILRDKMPAEQFNFLSLNVMNASLKDFVHSDDTKAFSYNIDELFNQRFQYLKEEAIKVGTENEITSPMTPNDALQFIREHHDKLPEPTIENIGQFASTQSSTKSRTQTETKSKKTESKPEPETPAEVILPSSKRERPKRKVSKR